MSKVQESSRELSPSASGPKSALLPSEVLAKAADLIEPEGRWVRGALYGPDEGPPSYCVIGAICAVAKGTDWREKLADRSRKFVANVLGEPDDVYVGEFGTAIVPHWNDADDRTQAEVVAALRKASELAKAEGQ